MKENKISKNNEPERGLVCLFCGEEFGYAGTKPDEKILQEACNHEAQCPENPYKKRIAELEAENTRLKNKIRDINRL